MIEWKRDRWTETVRFDLKLKLSRSLNRFTIFWDVLRNSFRSSSVAKQEPGVSGVSTKSQSRGSRKTHKLMNIGLVYVNSYYGYNLSFITRMANVIQHLGCNNSVNIDSHKFRINL